MIQYSRALVMDREAAAYWIPRWSLSPGAHLRDPLARNDGVEAVPAI
jgi:hypothetical protein